MKRRRKYAIAVQEKEIRVLVGTENVSRGGGIERDTKIGQKGTTVAVGIAIGIGEINIAKIAVRGSTKDAATSLLNERKNLTIFAFLVSFLYGDSEVAMVSFRFHFQMGLDMAYFPSGSKI